jgi:hypothetical protein
VQVRDAVLHPDDQIAFDRNRFLLEAPGMAPRSDHEVTVEEPVHNITQTMQAIRLTEAKPAPATERNKNDIWWLIGAAALIAVGIALLLFVRF